MGDLDILRRFISLILLLLAAFISSGQDAMKGKEFWLGFLQNNESEPNISLFISISSETSTTGTVSIPLQNWSTNFSVSAGKTITVNVPTAMAENTISGNIQNKGIRIIANDSITVFATNYAGFTSDGSYIIPEQFLRTHYYVLSYNAYNSWPNDMLIVASKDNTTLEITPSVTTLSGHSAGIPFSLMLNAGQSYLLKSANGADITGTQIRGKDKCNSFAVFAGSKISNIPVSCVAADHIYDQMLPLEFWGKQYLITPVNGAYSLRIVAAEDNTDITINGLAAGNLNAGNYLTFENQTEAKYVVSKNPVMIAQFLQGSDCAGSGDPAMVILPPADHTYNKVFFSTLALPNITNHYLNIVVKSQFINQVLLNGSNISSGFIPFPGAPGYSYKKVEIKPGFHILKADSGLIANVFGIGGWNSYFYSAGYKGENNNYDFHFGVPVCAGAPVSFTATGNGITSCIWNFGDNSTKSGISVEHSYDLPGIYSVTLIINKQNSECPDTVIKKISVPQAPIVDLVKDTIICGSKPILIQAKGKANSYLWSNGETGSFIITQIPGVYWLKTSNDVCTTIDTVVIRKYPNPELKLNSETIICENSEYIINPMGAPSLNYIWSTGETTPSIKAIHEGLYWVEASNYCGSAKDSTILKIKPAPQISAGSDTTILQGTYAELKATGVEGTKNLWSPDYELSCTDCPDPNASPQQTTTYYLFVYGENDCFASDSVTVYVDNDLKVFIPDIFSPNGDGINDIFFIRGKGVKSIHLMVYNRWGEKIFETTDINTGWDGTFRGIQLQQSVFVYYLDAFLQTDQRVIKKGDITLVR